MIARLPGDHPLAGCVEFGWWTPPASAPPPAVPGAPAPWRPTRALPDGRVELIWTPTHGFVIGGHVTRHLQVPGGMPDGLSAVQFRFGAAAPALGIDGADVAEGTILLRDLLGREADLLAERVAAGATPRERTGLVLAVVAERAAGLRADPVVTEAERRLATPGTRIRDVGDAVGLSERQLLRRFRRDVGFGPKRTQRIVRFLGFAEHIRAHGDVGRAAFAAGYADQAHLTREAQALAGTSPGVLLHEYRRAA